jgi:hypothetical protein
MTAPATEAASFNEHHVHAVIHRIYTRLEYAAPPFSISRVMEALFPEVEVVARTMKQHAVLEVYPAPLATGARALLAYNEKDHHSTQRFSIAHELGHFIFDCDFGRAPATVPSCGGSAVGSSSDDDGAKPLIERRADFFAAELLCPLWILDPMVDFTIYPAKDERDEIRERDQRIQRLASRFNLSLACLKRRVFDLAAWRRLSRGR